MSHIVTTHAWLLANPSDEELTDVELEIDLSIDRDGAWIEGYSILGKSVRLNQLRELNPKIDDKISDAVDHYLANLPDEGE